MLPRSWRIRPALWRNRIRVVRVKGRYLAISVLDDDGELIRDTRWAVYDHHWERLGCIVPLVCGIGRVAGPKCRIKRGGDDGALALRSGESGRVRALPARRACRLPEKCLLKVFDHGSTSGKILRSCATRPHSVDYCPASIAEAVNGRRQRGAGRCLYKPLPFSFLSA